MFIRQMIFLTKMNYYIKSLSLLVCFSILLFGCGSSSGIISTPIENIDDTPLKVSPLTKSERHSWSHLDLVKDTIPGMSVDKAYSEVIKNKKGKTVIVAVIDSAVDIDHEDLNDVLWVNKDEIPNNGIDDDNNGYIDDIHGWNFIGDTYYEQFEYVRLLASGDKSHPRYAEAEEKYNVEFKKYSELKINSSSFLQDIIRSDNAVSTYLKKKDYTKEEVAAIKTDDKLLSESVALINYIFSLDYGSVTAFKAAVEGDLENINTRLNYHLNKSFKGRKTGDDPNDISDIGYGNNNPRPTVKKESHGTHVSGIILAERDNNLGIKGVANNAQLMAIRAIPNGDEYDKDVALAIRYAADNGAQIINLSFGKSFSPHSNWVRQAIIYAASKDVLIVHGSGNDGFDIDTYTFFPNDAIGTEKEVADNYIKVGALTPRYGSGMVAYYSNFGNVNVDVFAPGSEIYSSLPENEYKLQNGTSMSAPNVAGVAALIRSQYPKLTASQVKQIIMDSGLPIKTKVVVGESREIKNLTDISKSGKIVNAYNALIMASQITN